MQEYEAFLEQAGSDFAAYRTLAAADELPDCHWLHFIQMVAEKLGKAARKVTRQAGSDALVHVGLSRIVSALKGDRDAAAILGMDFAAYRHFMARAHCIIAGIEGLHPGIGPPENVEYPWSGRDAAGMETWIPPSRHEFRVASELRQTSDGAKLIKLFTCLLQPSNFSRVFV